MPTPEEPPTIPAALVQFLPTVERILYGTRVVQAHLAPEVARLGAERVFFVTTRALAQSRIAEQVCTLVQEKLVGRFAASMEHVPLGAVVQAAAAARGCNPDLVVALGGGSAIDAAKATRACLAAGLTSAMALGEFLAHPAPLQSAIPQLSIPTTLSGAEYTRSFSATNFDQGVKRSYTSSALASRVILYDPWTTLQTPPSLWLSSGVMAIDHAVEVFCATPEHLVGDAMKLASLRKLLAYLPRTRTHPDDLEARLHCQVAAWQADHSPMRTQLLATPSLPLLSHALAYELASLYRIPYGLIACTTLVPCLRWCATRYPVVQHRQAALGRALGLATGSAPAAEAARLLADGLEDLIAGLGLPARLREVGVGQEHLVPLARQFQTRHVPNPSGQPLTENDIVELLHLAW